jgi:hypothetical protein
VAKYDVAGDPRCQDEMLKQLPSVAEQTEYTTLKSELLPRMHTLCLKTTSASVRVNSLTCMGRLAARLDEDEAGKMLQTAGKVCLLVCLRPPFTKTHHIRLCLGLLGSCVCVEQSSRRCRQCTFFLSLLHVPVATLLLSSNIKSCVGQSQLG